MFVPLHVQGAPWNHILSAALLKAFDVVCQVGWYLIAYTLWPVMTYIIQVGFLPHYVTR